MSNHNANRNNLNHTNYNAEQNNKRANICNVLELLEQLIRDEKKDVAYYEKLAEKCRNKADKEDMTSIRRDCKRHATLLEDIYLELCGREYQCSKGKVCLPKGYCESLQTGMVKKVESVDVLEELACVLRQMKHKEIVCCIINDEKEHARMLAAMYKACER